MVMVIAVLAMLRTKLNKDRAEVEEQTKDCSELVDFYFGTCKTWLAKGAKLSLSSILHDPKMGLDLTHDGSAILKPFMKVGQVQLCKGFFSIFFFSIFYFLFVPLLFSSLLLLLLLL